jgi:hypothetical protein
MQPRPDPWLRLILPNLEHAGRLDLCAEAPPGDECGARAVRPWAPRRPDRTGTPTRLLLALGPIGKVAGNLSAGHLMMPCNRLSFPIPFVLS